MFGDGLENYPDKGIDSRREDGRFDILAANPPYSVAAFKPHLKLHDNELKVLDEITDNGSEIETAFVERAAQLVRPGGYAAIVLPSSILDKGTNSSFTAARDVMLSSFELVAIARFGSGTFAATGTNVAIMFMRRFDEVPARDANARDFVDAVFNGEDLGRWSDGETYASYLKLIGVDEADYFAFVNGARPWGEWAGAPHFGAYAEAFPKTKALKDLKKTRAYKKDDADAKTRKEDAAFYRYAHAEERKRLRVFALVHGERTLVVNSPTATSEVAAFLGYKWSNRKGNEGIQLIDGGGVLYSEDPADAGAGTISGVIRSWFQGEEAEASDISQHYYYADTERFIDFDGGKFDETLKMPRTFYQPRKFARGVEVRTLGDVASYVSDTVAQENIDVGTYVTTDSMAKGRGGIEPYEGDAPASAGTAYRKGDTLVSNIRSYLQKVWLADRDGACSKDVLVFRTKDESVVLPEFLHLLLWQRDFFDYDMSTFTGTGRPRGDKKQILSYRIPVPDVNEQRRLVASFVQLSKKTENLRKHILTSEASVVEKCEQLANGYGRSRPTTTRLADLIETINSGTSARGGSGVTVVSPRCVETRHLRLDKAKSVELSNEMFSKYCLMAGYLVVVRVNGSPDRVGSCALVDEKQAGIVNDDNTFRVRLLPSLDPRYLVCLLTTPSIRSAIVSSLKVTSGQYSLDQGSLKSLEIPLPPLALQKQFADFAEKADNEQTELQKQLDALSQERDMLLGKYLA